MPVAMMHDAQKKSASVSETYTFLSAPGLDSSKRSSGSRTSNKLSSSTARMIRPGAEVSNPNT